LQTVSIARLDVPSAPVPSMPDVFPEGSMGESVGELPPTAVWTDTPKMPFCAIHTKSAFK
jgi:hypothetical protein